MRNRRRIPPLTACIVCRLNPKRTWDRHYQCPACLAEVARPASGKGQLTELPGETWEDIFFPPAEPDPASRDHMQFEMQL